MPTLAPKLPYTHPFAGGYPRLGGQPLPTDPDAIDYLNRVAAADGAAVEVGVAVAVDAFFRELKATPGLFDAIKASCILCGARTLAGALVPLAGDAPTAQGGWASGDYSRTAGMTGDGNALYLDSNRSNADDPQDDQHLSVFVNAVGTSTRLLGLVGAGSAGAGQVSTIGSRSRNSSLVAFSEPAEAGFVGVSRSSSSGYDQRFNQIDEPAVIASQTPLDQNIFIFRISTLYTDSTIAFYSIGTSLSLEDLDTAVSNLITAIGEAL